MRSLAVPHRTHTYSLMLALPHPGGDVSATRTIYCAGVTSVDNTSVHIMMGGPGGLPDILVIQVTCKGTMFHAHAA